VPEPRAPVASQDLSFRTQDAVYRDSRSPSVWSLGTTLLVLGFAVRPASRTPTSRRRPSTAARYFDKAPSPYEEDHLISLELGGKLQGEDPEVTLRVSKA
jgi:hypothetical protein